MAVLNWQYKTYGGDEIPVYITKRVRASFVSTDDQYHVERELEIIGDAYFCVHYYQGMIFDCYIYYEEASEGGTCQVICTDVYTGWDTPTYSKPASFMNVLTYEYPLTRQAPDRGYFYFGEKTLICASLWGGHLISYVYKDAIYGIDRNGIEVWDISTHTATNPCIPPDWRILSWSQPSEPAGSWTCWDCVSAPINYFWGDGEHVDPDSHNPQDDQGGEDMIGPGVKSGLFSVYIPTDFNMSRFTSWLWGSGFDITQLKKLFNDPMESIISLHAIYMDIPSQGTSTIQLGNLDSQIGCPYTTDTIKTVACGSINISETFANVLDYDPFTKVEIYLPYIGFKPLKASEIMGGSISVSYKVDIVTGACVALVSVNKENNVMVAYSYSGNCAVALPITGANYRDVIRNITSTALSVGTAVMTGGATAPLAVGAVGNLALGSQVHVERSGSITSNTGMLGDPVPYLIITRPVPAQPTNFQQYYGYPASQLTLISACSGYTRVKECHLSIDATEKEKEEIESLLKSGIIV